MRRGITFAALIAWFTAGLCHPQAQAGGNPSELAVIVHPDNKTDNISLDTLRAIFLKQKKKWADGSSVIVLNFRARSRPRISFDRIVLSLLPDEAAAYWIDRRIRGKGHPPRSLASSRLIQRIVARNPEAVTYVPADEVSGKVKVISVDGRKPGSKGYLLRMEDTR